MVFSTALIYIRGVEQELEAKGSIEQHSEAQLGRNPHIQSTAMVSIRPGEIDCKRGRTSSNGAGVQALNCVAREPFSVSGGWKLVARCQLHVERVGGTLMYAQGGGVSWGFPVAEICEFAREGMLD